MQPTQTSANGAAHTELQAQLAAMREEFDALREEVAHLRWKCADLQQTVLALSCPTDWLTKEIDEKELERLRQQSAGVPTLREFVHGLKAEGVPHAPGL
jgi:uncharacterized protein HemX